MKKGGQSQNRKKGPGQGGAGCELYVHEKWDIEREGGPPPKELRGYLHID